MKEMILKKAWVFSDIEGVREVEEGGTYYIFEYDKLPPIEINLDNEFNWLRPHSEYLSEEDWSYDFKEQLEILQKDAKSKGLVIPKNFIEFMGTSDLLRRIRSNTDCYFELGDYIAEIPNTNGLYFLHFLSDSQYCRLWYLCLDKEGNNCIVSSYKVYGHIEDPHEEEDDDDDNEYTVDYFCAPTFNDFIYRFWIENEIWFKIHEQQQLDEIEQRYVQYYLDNKN